MLHPTDTTEVTRVSVFASLTGDRLKRLVRSRLGSYILFLISFTESMLPVPILTDPFLVLSVMLDRARALRAVIVTMLGSVIGGTIAFITAAYFREPLFALLSPELLAAVNSFTIQAQDTFVLTIVGAITPVPYTVVAWAVALSGGNVLVFMVASVVGRLVRYGIVGWCSYTFGPTALAYARRSIWWTSAVVFLVVAVYVWLRL
jgi:membrane protein YqaA with SNARE-associated domain